MINNFRNIFTFGSILNGFNKVLKIFGLSCFKYPSDTYKLSFIGSFMLILNLFFNILEIYGIITKNLVTVLDSTKNVDKIVGLISIGTYAMSFFCSLFIIVINFVLRKKIFLMFKSLKKFNYEILHHKINVNDFRDVGLLYLIWSLKILSLLLMAKQMYPGYDNILVLILVLISVFSVYVPVEIFIGIIYLVQRRIHYVVIKLR